MTSSKALSTAAARKAAPAKPSPPRTERFRLEGPTRPIDRRVNAVRRDIADIALAGTLFAPHYALAEQGGCGPAPAMMLSAADAAAEAVSQLLPGEGFAVLDIAGGWAWGYSSHDHYVGYVREASLAAPIEATHVVTAPLAPVFAAPDIKAAVKASWSLGARFTGEAANGFIACAEGFVHQRHAAPIDAIAPDPVAAAESLLGLPYLWGGRGAGGIDCSGLVQIALARAGHAVPRDTDQQRGAIGVEIGADEPLKRGDLVFFPGHVGLMADAEQLVHANAHWMAVVIEPLADVVARLAPNHDRPISARRRIA